MSHLKSSLQNMQENLKKNVKPKNVGTLMKSAGENERVMKREREEIFMFECAKHCIQTTTQQ